MNVLLVEDEPQIASFIKRGLEEEGYQVTVAYDGETCFALLPQADPDIVILDIILPGMNGWDICRKIKLEGPADVPVLMLSALGTTDNIVKGLDTGADDYLVKPFKLQELLARMRALLRRKERGENHHHLLQIADLTLDRQTKIVTRAGQEIKLTATEFRLLEFFLRNQRKVLTRTSILESVWDINFNLGTNVVDVYVNYLRNKLDKGFATKLIHTVIGMGYTMREEQNV